MYISLYICIYLDIQKWRNIDHAKSRGGSGKAMPAATKILRMAISRG